MGGVRTVYSSLDAFSLLIHFRSLDQTKILEIVSLFSRPSQQYLNILGPFHLRKGPKISNNQDIQSFYDYLHLQVSANVSSQSHAWPLHVEITTGHVICCVHPPPTK